MRSDQRGPDFAAVRQQAADLLEAIGRGEVAPVYLFSGEDDFQRQAMVRRVVARLVPEEQRDTQLQVLDGGDATGRQVAGELESAGFRFGDEPRRVVLVRDAPFFQSGKAELGEPLKARLESGLLEDVVLVMEVRGNVDKRLGVTKAVAAVGICLEFPKLANERDVEQFLQARLRRAEKTMSRSANAELVVRCGTDAQILANEADKLISYVGDRGSIELADVQAMVAPTAALSVFDLVDAVAERKTQAALDQLEGLLGQQAEPFMILAMLIRQFRLLLQARYLIDEGLVDNRLLNQRPYDFGGTVNTKKAGRSLLDEWKEQVAGVLPTEGKQSLFTQHYFPLYRSLATARRLPAGLLEGAMERLLQTDLGLKSSHLDPRLEMETLVVDLCTRMEAGATVAYDTLLDI